jgi:chromosome partitioning protein
MKTKTVSFAHQKGGVGKSTLSYNTAYYLSKVANKKTLLVDLDVQQTATNLNFLRKVNGFGELEVQVVNDDRTLVSLIDADKYDYIVVDAGGFDADINRAAIALSDVIITPVTTKITEIFGLGKFVEILDEINAKTNTDVTAHVVLNNLHPSTKDIKIIEDLCKESKRIVLAKGIIRARATFPATLAAGLTVFERRNGEDKAAEEMEVMIKELILN